MITLIKFQHDFYNNEYGLAHCKVCGGAEGSLPTDCPKVQITEEQDADIYSGKIDFKDGEWVELK